jgi:queuine/archaeosine tRNA-ribosyltransferase
VKRWWSTQTDDKVLLTVRYGARAIEFQKGKDAIEVENIEALPAMLKTVRQAVAEGELDELLAKYAEYGGNVRKRAK